MTEASETQKTTEDSDSEADLPDLGAELRLQIPDREHAAEMWRLAKESGTLDLNSSYAYLLFGRDFSNTCRVALAGGKVVGFVMGYVRPAAPDCYFVWQIAVDRRARGDKVGGRLLDRVVDELPAVRRLETTITADNLASRRLFESFARRRGASLRISPLFEEGDFPDHHEAEALYEISELSRRS